MSLETGLQAMNLRMTPRVPRVEFDAEVHWHLVKEVVGLEINEQSSEEQRRQASLAFMQAWNYDLRLEPLISHETVAKKSTNMGNEVKRCMDLGKKCPGYFIGVSNMIPPNTPVENALYYNELYQMLCKR